MLAAKTSTCFSTKSVFSGKSIRCKTTARPVAAGAPAFKVVAAGVGESWMPGTKHPAHLDGSLPGDFGFDPLMLGKDPKDLAWYVQAELVHARFAMLGTAGILIPEALTKAGLLNVPVWYEAGASASPIDFQTLLFTQALLMGWAEAKRYYDIKSPGSGGTAGSFLGMEAALKGTDAVGYPGGGFDPLGFGKDPAELAKLKVKEIKNGRLAMISMLGYYGQAAATGTGPVDNWLTHIADPFHTCVTSNANAIPFL